MTTIAARILRTEIRHSAFVWCIPLLVLLFIYDPYRTASGYPELWTLRSTVVLNKYWPDMVIFAAGFAAWAGSREGRRNTGDLLATTARPAWTRQLCSLAGTAFWVVAAFLAGVIAIYVQTAQVATWGTAPVWPVVVGVVGLLMVCAVAFTLGALFPGRFTAPIVAVAMMFVTLVAFKQAVNQSGPVPILSPDGEVPGNDWGIYYPTSIGVPIVQTMFMGGVALAAVGLLGLSPRTGGTGWRGALSAVSAGGALLRTVATVLFAGGIALAVVGFGLAGTATGSPAGGQSIPAFDDIAGAKAIPYTPVCSTGSFQVCLHPAYRPYLSQTVAALDAVIAELAGLPGVPVRATEVNGTSLPSIVLDSGADGTITGNPPVYEFSMDNAIGLDPQVNTFGTGFQQGILQDVIIGSAGTTVQTPGGPAFQPTAGNPAQQAVVMGLLKALDPSSARSGTRQDQSKQAQVIAAATKFAALPAATRHAWLLANLTALKAGHITLAQLP
jgi:hypothetical protein